MKPILEINGVGKVYGDFRALTNVNFSVYDGETFAIVGPNGAGKTTLFRVMTGEVFNDEGSIAFLGQDISRLAAHERVSLGLGRTFQIARVFPEFSSMTNVIVAIEARNRNRNESVSQISRIKPSADVREEAAQRLASIGLGNELATEARHLSLGDKKRLELALTLALEPIVLLLDEPTAGMSPSERHSIIDLISEVKTALGLTIILTEHDMDFVFRLSKRIMVMNQGQVVLVGDQDELRNSATVREIYLGKEMVDA
jgi:branched-chain amino acid transport system ATP-binding protein